MNSESPYKIHVAVESAYIEDQSDPGQDRYVFAYTVTVRNVGSIPAKLVTRHWVITDANGRVQEVRGEGVVGEQPYMKPGEGFQYTSGTMIETPVGSMHGSYEFQRDNGALFDVPIQAFSLSVPNVVH